MPSRYPQKPSDLDQRLAGASASASLYLRPLGVVAGEAAEALTSDGRAHAIAGGPLAATLFEIAVRDGSSVSRFVADAGSLTAWTARGAGPQAARIATLLGRIQAPRDGLADGPFLMGVVNVTPDSFSDGGLTLDPGAALARCRALAAEGAGILDIGGESTRPGATPVAPAEEWARVRPVLEGLRAMRPELPGVQISIDTRHASVMRGALTAGVDIINDITGLTGDADSLAVAAGSSARVVLMHMQGTPATMNEAPVYDDVALDVFDALEARVEACLAAGIPRSRLIVDPGIGFGKRGRENRAVLRSLTLLHGLGCPILLGLSRKGLGVSDQSVPPAGREPTSHGAAMYALSAGIQMLRVHDVAGARQVVTLWRRLSERSS